MSSGSIRILLLADTHLGFDLPFHPRIQRRRRGHDFFANFEKALEPALRGKVDLVVHGGDLFFRSKVPAALIEMAFAPLIRVAERGIPIYLVPGNHERSRIPRHLWGRHANIHIFDRPRTFDCATPKGRIALSGFPYESGIRNRLAEIVAEIGHAGDSPHFLCMHQVVEGAQVGTVDYTFRRGPHVIRGVDIPGDFTAVLSGHIHRAQILHDDLRGRSLAAPVVYAGAIERTSFAERNEEKGFVILKIDPADHAGRSLDCSFVPLSTRPMVNLVVEPQGMQRWALDRHLYSRLRSLDPDSIVRVQLRGPGADRASEMLSAASLRALAPPSMNISLAINHPARKSVTRKAMGRSRDGGGAG